MVRPSNVRDGFILNMPLLRHYLAPSQVTTGEGLVADAILYLEPGAQELVQLALQLRRNRRTRGTLRQVGQQFRLAGATGPCGTPSSRSV